MPETIHIVTRSTDRDKTVYPSPSSYRITLPRRVDAVTQIQVSTLELPLNNTHLTIEEDVNDRIWFSEGLKVDIGESTNDGGSPSILVTDVNGVSGLNMSVNQIGIREADTTNFIVGVPAYLCPITSVDGSTGVVTALDSSNVYQCYEAWRVTQIGILDSPRLSIVCPQTRYSETYDASAVRVPGDSSLFADSFIHCPPLSVEELCSYLTFAFQNYATYFGSGSSPANRYTVEYTRGKVQITFNGSTSATLHYPDSTNASVTLHYGTQYPQFDTRNELNSSGANRTSLGYMLGLQTNQLYKTWTDVISAKQTRSYTGFRAIARPRFLFEARLLPGNYTQQSLSTYLPIAMNPLYFPKNSDEPGACYFGFRDSLGIEKIAVIHVGQYTVETFCRALSYLLTRLDSQGLFHDKDRFAYRNTPLDADAGVRPALDMADTIVYNVRYNFTTSKFTIESKFTSAARANEPSGNDITVSDRPAPPFSLLFQPSTLARIAANISDLSSLCSASQIDRVANVLGFELQDYVGESTYTSTNASYIPRIPCTLSQGSYFTVSRPKTFESVLPTTLGLSSAPNSAGLPTYFYPSGQYQSTGNSPSTHNLNLSSNAVSGVSMPQVTGKKGQVASDTVKVTIVNDGQIASDFSVTTAGTYYSTNTYVVGDATYTSPQRPGNVIMQVTDVSYASTSPVQTLALVTAGSGLSAAADVSFNAIPSYQAYRKGVVSTSTTDTTCTFSSHNIFQSATSLAATTCEPLGFQVGDVIQIACAQESLVTSSSAITASITVSATGIQRGIPGSTTYTHSGASTLVLNDYHVVLGGNYDAIVKVTTGGAASASVIEVVVPGSGYYSGDTYSLSKPIRYEPFTAIVTQLPNAGGQFIDATNASNELFYSSLPLLTHSLSSVSGRYSDGSVIRARIPSHLLDNGFGHVDSIKKWTDVRTDFHVEDSVAGGIREYSAHDVVGIGVSNLSMSSTLIFPNNMNVAPPPYLLVCFKNMSYHVQTMVLDDGYDTNSSQDVLGKVVIGAPVAISKTSPLSIYLKEAAVDHIDVEFRLPDNRSLYNFHGLEHTMTLSFVQEHNRGFH